MAYLTNPAYFSEITRRGAPPTDPMDEDVRFYRRRLISLYKDLLSGEKVCDSLDEAHGEFVRLAIAHFKRIDTDEILQKEHEGAEAQHTEAQHAEVGAEHIEAEIAHINDDLFKKEISVPTLDDFILSTKPDVPETPPPHKRIINLRDEQFRHKGVPKKQVSIHEDKV